MNLYFSHLLHSLFQVVDDVINVLYANRESDEVGRHACLTKLFFG